MKPVSLFSLLLSVAATLAAQSHPVSRLKPPAVTALSSGTSQVGPATRSRMLETYGRLPLAFEANQGQNDPQVKFLSRGAGYSLFLSQTEAVMALGPVSRRKADSPAVKALPSRDETPAVLRMKLIGANAETKVFGQGELPGKGNYFIGNDPRKWQTNIPTYEKVKYEGIYPGIDLVYYGNQRQLEYDFIVAPGADPRRIKFDVNGASLIHRDAQGELVFQMGKDEIRWHKPVVYQEKDGARQLIAAHYSITDKNRVGFEVAAYDAHRPLYIDPLVYSTYLGGTSSDQGYAITVDNAGNAYVGGITFSGDFPTKDPLPNFGLFAFVSKINASGTALVYSTYLGAGNTGASTGIAVDSVDNAYVTGYTQSANFPTTPGAFQTTYGGTGNTGDAFVAKINPAGSALVYSSFLGGSWTDFATGIALDSGGNAYVTGFTESADFPTTPGAPQTVCNGGSGCDQIGDAFVAKINPTGSALVYSTYLGGSNYDRTFGIAVDGTGHAEVVGGTESADFPVTPGAFQTACNGGSNCATSADGFVAKLNPSGTAFVYATYLGGSGFDQGYSIAADGVGNAFVTGFTTSADFPTTPGSFQPASGGSTDAFVSKLNPSGSALVYSTYLGGAGGEFGNGITLDSTGSVYVTGTTGSTNFPLKDPLQKSNRNGGNFFVSELNPTGSALFFSTYFGGTTRETSAAIAVDSPGTAYLTGTTFSNNYPTTPGAIQTVCNGGHKCWNLGDAFVTKIHFATTITTLSSSPNPSIKGQAVTFTAVVSSSLGTRPADGETVTFMRGTKVLGSGSLSGGAASFTTSTLTVGPHLVKAVYGGDSTFSGSTSKVVNQVVIKGAP
jgi:hypothetical protein